MMTLKRFLAGALLACLLPWSGLGEETAVPEEMDSADYLTPYAELYMLPVEPQALAQPQVIFEPATVEVDGVTVEFLQLVSDGSWILTCAAATSDEVLILPGAATLDRPAWGEILVAEEADDRIKENLRKICTTEEMRKIEVIHLDAWVSRFLRQQDYGYTIKYGDEIMELWESASRATGDDMNYPDGFFEEEWNSIVQAQGITTMQEYAKAPRTGRGVRLDRKNRIAVWKVFEEYRTLMNMNKVRDSATAMNECCQILKTQPDYHPYAAIVVDEGQDFGMAAFRLLRSIAGDEHENDLFIVGDAHQRIYRNKVTLSKCGISVRGRSSKLRVNYRTTEEIRNWAMRVLKGIPVDDLDGGLDDAKGYRSLSHGEAPVVDIYDTYGEEAAALVKHIQEKIEAGLEPMEICVVARTNKMLSDYASALGDAGIRTYEIKRSKTDDRHMPGVCLATMHRVKGLEFTCVFIVGMTKAAMPLKSALRNDDPISNEETIASERCLLYVALTRAKKAAYISAYGQASEFIA